jgi:hypothetical protein
VSNEYKGSSDDALAKCDRIDGLFWCSAFLCDGNRPAKVCCFSVDCLDDWHRLARMAHLEGNLPKGKEEVMFKKKRSLNVLLYITTVLVSIALAFLVRYTDPIVIWLAMPIAIGLGLWGRKIDSLVE